MVKDHASPEERLLALIRGKHRGPEPDPEKKEARETEARKLRRLRFRRANPAPDSFDLILNAGAFDGDLMAGLIVAAVQARSLAGFGFLPFLLGDDEPFIRVTTVVAQPGNCSRELF